jgi:tripartite-type tricarboxylate transporter receptor subunit TctC
MPGLLCRLLSVAALAAVTSHAPAQTDAYPSRPIRVIVPYSAGSGVDVLARTYGQALQKELNTPAVIDNREGATGIIGSQAVARAAPDGYTIMVNASPPFAVAPLSQKSPPYDVLTAFTPIARVGSVPLVMITATGSPVKSFAQLRDQAHASPAAATYASTGNGSPGQLYMELVKSAVDMRLTEVPYKSSAQALTDVVAGHILASLVSLPAAEPLIEQGRLRVLAVGSRDRLKRYPEAPTLAEALKSPGLEASVWYGFLAPANLPAERVEVLYKAVAKVFGSEEVKSGLNTLGIVPDLQPPAEFAASLRRDTTEARRMLALVEKNKAK